MYKDPLINDFISNISKRFCTKTSEYKVPYGLINLKD